MTPNETNRRAAGAVLLSVALLLPGAGLSEIYRSVMQDGSVVFSDSPPEGAAATDRLADPAPPSPLTSPVAEPVGAPEVSAGGLSTKPSK
ncbi:MAG: DUF4124 domain-containing protein [Chloroflexales bacterium]|nr:DUF4124 domain-containing protein [Chloroflexales bacterium]